MEKVGFGGADPKHREIVGKYHADLTERFRKVYPVRTGTYEKSNPVFS
jgi:hypothetical protein